MIAIRLSFITIPLLILCIIVGVYGAPTRKEELLLESRKPLPLQPSAKEAKTWFEGHIKELHGPFCFYSGSTDGVSAWSQMKKFKKEHECIDIDTVFEAMLKGKTEKQKSDFHVEKRGWADAPEWQAVSLALAQHVHGQVLVLLGKEIRDGATWQVAEKNALIANMAVTSIVLWELASAENFQDLRMDLKKEPGSNAGHPVQKKGFTSKKR